MIDGRNLLEVKPLVDLKVIKETLNRIGIANKRKKILYPSCYLYETDGQFYLAHFKQMFVLTRDNSYDNICEEDIVRRNAIAFCCKNWGLIEVDSELIEPHDKFVFVLSHRDKDDWRISHKFNFRVLEQTINT